MHMRARRNACVRVWFFLFFFFFFLKSNVYVKDYVHISLQARPGAARESISPPRASQRLSVKRTKEEKEKKKRKKRKKEKRKKKREQKKRKGGEKKKKREKKTKAAGTYPRTR